MRGSYLSKSQQLGFYQSFTGIVVSDRACAVEEAKLTHYRIFRHPIKVLFFIPAFLLIGMRPDIAYAAKSSTTAVFQQLGSGAPTSYGDYISSAQAGGMNTFHQYYLEVPAGMTRLRVRIWDADVGRGTTNHFDWQSGNSWNTSCRYTLYNPSNTQVATFTGNATTGTDNNWTQLYNTTTTPIPAGHWRLIVDTSSTVTGGDDCNGYGISADDGDDTSGGIEVNVYAYSFAPVGERNVGTTQTITTTLYPYITSGCTVDWNDWDGDDPTPGQCTIVYASRTGAFTGNYRGSGSTVWQNHPITGYESDTMASDTGLWRGDFTYTATSTGTNGSNYGILYFGNENAANTPPSAQPEANTFRVYLPTDGGGKPLKPFLTQNISYISGANPPTAGSATRVRVEVSIFNPTPYAISFSSISPITANVPGGGVVYALHWTASQGTLVSEPAENGTGDVVWNPGTVARYSDAGMSYAVDVWPSSGGQRLLVTGTPALNGTRATYTDETGAATYTYGPLCGMAVTEGPGNDVPTWIAVASLQANMDGGRPTVEWRTGTEVGTAGFFLYRQNPDTGEYELVNPSFLPALYESPLGGIYRLEDPGVPIGKPVLYRLTEVDASGRTRVYGPYRLTFGASGGPSEHPTLTDRRGSEIPSSVPGFRKWTYRPSDIAVKRVQDRLRVLQLPAAPLAAGSHDRIRIAVKTDGLVRLDAGLIAPLLGQSTEQVQWLILHQQLKLSSAGELIPWLAETNGAGLYFYGLAPDSPFADRNVYWLEKGTGLVMEAVPLGSATPVSNHAAFQDAAHFEENRYAVTALAKNPREDFWFWNYIVAGTDDKSFTIDVPGRATTGSATLTVLLRGATDTAAVQDHHAKVFLNKVEVGSGWWNGTNVYTLNLPVVPALLKEGRNTISIRGLLDLGAPYSVFYVNSFDLSYPRYYRAKDNRLVCRADANSVISVEGLTDTHVLVLDITRPARPRACVGMVVDNQGRLAFVPASSQSRYLISGLSAALTPFSMTAAAAPTLKQAGQFAPYLIITPEEFKGAAQGLAKYRRDKGLEAQVVTVEEIYDAFNEGVPGPQAIKDFLAFAYDKGPGKRPDYVVLAGKGTYDYKDYLGFGDNLIPPLLSRTPDGLFASDRAFGDVKGEDSVPEIAVGRLPIVSKEELEVAVRKIKTYENAGTSQTKRAILIADNPDDAGNFRKGSDLLAKQIKGYSFQRIYLLNGAHADEVRTQIIAGFNANPALVNYLGHGGIDQLAGENILNVSDLPSLRNGNRLPIMVLLTCVAGRFEVPGSLSLTEGLALEDGGGIAAAVAPSGAATYLQTRALAEELYKAVYGANERGLGKAWLRAMKNFIALGGKPYLLNTFNLIGDPALRFK
jgi:hypothetical protein